MLGLRGQFISDGDPVAWAELATIEEWNPIPILLVPRLNGTCIFYRNGTVHVGVEAATDRWVIFPSLLEWRDVYVSLDVDPFNPSNMSSIPAMRVFARGGLLVGGDDGFYATIQGTLDTGARSATLAIQHAGGWSPISALPMFATPRFDGNVSVNVNGTYLKLAAAAQWEQPFGIGGLLTFVGHPATSSPGLAVSIDLLKETNASDSVYTVSAEGGLQLGSSDGGPPVLGFRGQFVSDGDSWLELQTIEEWNPMPILLVPRVTGSCILYYNGTVLLDVEAATYRVFGAFRTFVRRHLNQRCSYGWMCRLGGLPVASRVARRVRICGCGPIQPAQHELHTGDARVCSRRAACGRR